MGSPRTVLVVDDDADACEAAALALRRRGYAVVTADDGADAVRLIADQPPQVAVVNMMLPGASGFQVAQAAKDAADGRVPVVMVSAYASAAHQDYAFASGVDRFLAKPFPVAKLVDAVVALCPPGSGSKVTPVAATRR